LGGAWAPLAPLVYASVSYTFCLFRHDAASPAIFVGRVVLVEANYRRLPVVIIIRPHRMQSMRVQASVTDVYSVVCLLSVCLCVLVTTASLAKTDEPIDVQFEMLPRVDQRNYVGDASDQLRSRSPRKEALLEEAYVYLRPRSMYSIHSTLFASSSSNEAVAAVTAAAYYRRFGVICCDMVTCYSVVQHQSPRHVVIIPVFYASSHSYLDRSTNCMSAVVIISPHCVNWIR